MEFKNNGTLYYSIPKTSNITDIAGFDMDDTLITPIFGGKFASDKDDWEFLYDNIVSKLNELNDKGWKLLDEILTNANYINCKNISTIIILCILS
jgi:hypothetical protein